MLRPTLSLIFVGIIAGACGGAPPQVTGSPGTTSQASTIYQVTYNEGTSVVEATDFEAAVLASPDPSPATGETDGTYRFRPTDWANSLKPGQVVIFANHALVKVTSAENTGNEVVVHTERAALNEAIRDGQVSWSYPVDWNNLPAQSYDQMKLELARLSNQPMAMSGAGIEGAGGGVAEVTKGVDWSGNIQGFDMGLKLTPTPDQLNMELTAKKTLPGGTSVAASAKGWISNFTQETFLTYEQSQGGSATSKTIGLHGEVNVEWHAARLGEALTDVASFKLPVALPIPFTVGPIPVVLKLMATLQIVPELSVDQASSGGAYKLAFSTDQGINISGSSQTPFSDVKSVDIGVNGETVSAGFGVVAFALGIEFPRFEISVFGTTSAFITLKSYSSSQWTPGTTLTNDIPPCQMGTSSLAAYAGYSVAILGFKLAGSDPIELWKRDFTKYLNDKPCTLTGN
jgi:hypothetical protein